MRKHGKDGPETAGARVLLTPDNIDTYVQATSRQPGRIQSAMASFLLAEVTSGKSIEIDYTKVPADKLCENLIIFADNSVQYSSSEPSSWEPLPPENNLAYPQVDSSTLPYGEQVAKYMRDLRELTPESYWLERAQMLLQTNNERELGTDTTAPGEWPRQNPTLDDTRREVPPTA